jgi:Na+/proline symporter
MGLLIGGAVFPVAFSVIWLKQTKAGAISGAIVGLCAGLTAWLVEAKAYYGELTITTTGGNYPTLAGNLAAIMTGLIVTVAVSTIFPKQERHTWDITRAINIESLKKDNNSSDENSSAAMQDEELAANKLLEEEPKKLKSALQLAIYGSFIISFIMVRGMLHTRSMS